MESTTKTTFPLEVLKKFIKNNLGLPTKSKKITPLTDGRFNTVYDIQFVDDISDVVLRIAPNLDQHVLTFEKEMMRKELLVYKTIQQANIIPTPRLLGYDIEHQLIERDYMFIEKIYGQPLDKIQDRSSATDPESNQHQIGEITASTHSIRSKNFGYFGNGTEHGSATWGEAFSNFVETILNDGESLGVTFPFSYKNIRKIFNRHALLLNEVKHLVLVHWDLWPGNIFIIEKHEEFKVEGIIDWERAYWGDSESESAIATNFYSPTFFQGYGRPLPKGRNTAIRHKMYQIYLL